MDPVERAVEEVFVPWLRAQVRRFSGKTVLAFLLHITLPLEEPTQRARC